MKLTIYSLKGIEYQNEISAFNVKTTSGEITILDHHHPLITILCKGTAKITTLKGERIDFKISSGFLEMDSNNNLSVLID